MPNVVGQAACFLGDLDDPWVASIADALPGGVPRIACTGDLRASLVLELPKRETLVVHRSILTPHDAEQLSKLRREMPSAFRIILCIGPHARYADIERWSGLADVVISEATARDTLGRHLCRTEACEAESATPRPLIGVVSRNYELREALAEQCEAAGFSAESYSEWQEVGAGGLTVWDVPVLEPEWPALLARQSRVGSVVAMLGFADRALVSEARRQGASACLELPCDRLDLAWVLDRLSSARSEPAHAVPPPPASLRRPSKPVAEPGSGAYNGRVTGEH